MWQDPACIMNLYLPMRLHPMTRAAVNTIILKHKPANGEELDSEYNENVPHSKASPGNDAKDQKKEKSEESDMYYYGLLMMNHTVITIFKNQRDIAVTPCDINLMINFTKTNIQDVRKDEHRSFFREVCLPGMTEDFKLPVLYTYSSKSDLKIIYVCEEQNERVQSKLTDLSNRIFADLFHEKLISFLEHSELIMFENLSKCTFS